MHPNFSNHEIKFKSVKFEYNESNKQFQINKGKEETYIIVLLLFRSISVLLIIHILSMTY